MIIQGSLFGAIADLNQWSEFSCIKPNGTLNKQKYAEYIRIFANDGANSTREIPFLVTDNHYNGDPAHKQRNFLPFMWRDNRYDLSQLNPTYFDNLKEMIKIAARHNMSFQMSIFDRCHSLKMPDSPWNLNHQGVTGYYTWNEFTRAYVLQLIATAGAAEQELKEREGRDCQVFWELENEPMQETFMKTAIETLKLLETHSYGRDQVEEGVFYLPDEGGKPVITFKANGELIRNGLFEKFKRARRAENLFAMDGSDNSNYFVTIHNVGRNDDIWPEMAVALGHSHRISFSSDGEKHKPGPDEWYRRVRPLFEAAKTKKKKRNNLERWKFEQLYRGDLAGNSQFADDIHGARGIAQAYFDVFGEWPKAVGKWPRPATFGMFPNVIPGPDWDDDDDDDDDGNGNGNGGGGGGGDQPVEAEVRALMQQVESLKNTVAQHMSKIDALLNTIKTKLGM